VPTGSDVRFWSWTTTRSRSCGTTASSRSPRRRRLVDAARGPRRGRQRSCPRTAIPNGRLADFGNLKNGLTGDTGGYRHDWVDLTPYAGKSIQLRPALPHGRRVPGARLVRRRLLGDERRGHGVVRRRRERRQRLDAVARPRPARRAAAGSARPGRSSSSSTTSPSGATSAGSTTACATRTPHGGAAGRGAERGLHAVQRPRHAPVVPGLGLLEQRHGDHLTDRRASGRRAPSSRRRPSGPEHYYGRGGGGEPEPDRRAAGRQQANDAAFRPVGRYPFQACFQTSTDPA
jgi:hypothetical protein